MFKTGTANQYQHIWALGATRRFTVGVWMGNFSGETVVGRTGSSIPALIAADLLKALETASEGISPAGGGMEDPAAPVRPFGEPPGGVRELSVCALSGMAATPACGGIFRDWFREEDIPGPCVWHRPGAAEPVYPPEYRAWLAERFHRGGSENPGAGGRSIRIPVSGSVFYLDPSLPEEAQALRIETAGFDSGALVYADEVLQGSLNHAGVYVLPLKRGRHRIFVEDESGAAAAVVIEVR
jgi:penicillin-binding protein 1C